MQSKLQLALVAALAGVCLAAPVAAPSMPLPKGGVVAPKGPAPIKISETMRLQLLLKQLVPAGTKGFYLKEVGGEVILADNADFVFYPASTMKAQIHAAIMRKVELGQVKLTDTITVGSSQKTVQAALEAMMVPSSNADSNALIKLAGGINALNSLGAQIGMSSKSKFRHDYDTYGCPLTPREEKANTLTLRDAGRLWEAAHQGNIVKAPAYESFFEIAADEPETLPKIRWVADQEAARLGKSAAAVNAFMADVKLSGKGGWTFGADNTTYCLSEAGRVVIPARRGSSVAGAARGTRVFVFAAFGDFVSVQQVEASRAAIGAGGQHIVDAIAAEMLRPYIAAALLTY